MRCPICDKIFEPADSNAAPFCSERCRTIDLGRWLGEIYAMPVESESNEADLLDDDEPIRRNSPRGAESDE